MTTIHHLGSVTRSASTSEAMIATSGSAWWYAMLGPPQYVPDNSIREQRLKGIAACSRSAKARRRRTHCMASSEPRTRSWSGPDR